MIDALEDFSSSRERVKTLASAVARYADTRPHDFAWAMNDTVPLSPHHIVLAMAVAVVQEGAADITYRIGAQANDNRPVVTLAYAEDVVPFGAVHYVQQAEHRDLIQESLEISARSFALLKLANASTFLGRTGRQKAVEISSI